MVRHVMLAVAVAETLSAFGASVPLGTYVYTGSVMNYRHEVCSSEDGVTVQAVASDGTVLASCRVTDPVVSSGRNFVLEVPVSGEASSKSAAVGSELNVVLLLQGGVTNVSPRPLPPVAAANAITNVNLVSSSAQTFPYGDGSSVIVADEYLDMIAPLMAKDGRSAYDPAADWDGDGASNYDEYKAGTNPFDASDRLRITAFSAGGERTTLLSFEYAGGHLYAVDSSPALTNRTWNVEPFRVDPAEAAQQRSVSVKGNEYEDIGVMTLYLAPAGDTPSMFYAVRAE
jgi:hypothetical protein